MISVVLRTFTGPGGRPYERGQVVDTTDWRLERQLHEQRRLRAATQSEAAGLAGDGAKRQKR